MSRKMENLKEMICRELEEIADKGELSAGDLETVYKLIVSKEKLLRIEEIEDDMGYSADGEWRANGNYSRRNMPIYARDGYSNNSYPDGYSNRSRHYVRGHYSYADDVKGKIREMMDSTNMTAMQRDALQKAMDMM